MGHFAIVVGLVASLMLCMGLERVAGDPTSGLRVLRPRLLRDIITESWWMPYGTPLWTGREFTGTVTWVPSTALCSNVDDALRLGADEKLVRPATHTGPVNYTEVGQTIVLFNASAQCPLLNQVFYAEAVLGATGAIACVPRDGTNSPSFPRELTAPISHIPSIAVDGVTCQRLHDAVVRLHTRLEVSLGLTTSEMHYG